MEYVIVWPFDKFDRKYYNREEIREKATCFGLGDKDNLISPHSLLVAF